jgi:hypothetical protein
LTSEGPTERFDNMPPGFPPVEEIDLRWTLRDIHARRFKIMRLSNEDLQELINQGLVEMHGDEPALTEAGLAKIDR